jgi:hypothetical protein
MGSTFRSERFIPHLTISVVMGRVSVHHEAPTWISLIVELAFQHPCSWAVNVQDSIGVTY